MQTATQLRDDFGSYRAVLNGFGIKRVVFLCAGFRTGSTWFASLLAANGILDARHEWFANIWQDLPPNADMNQKCEYLAAIANKSGCTDTLAIKLMPAHRNGFSERFGLDGTPASFSGVFGDCVWLYLKRDDIIAQAVSFWRAKATDQWHPSDLKEGKKQPPYDFKAVREALRELSTDDITWRHFFAQSDIAPIDLLYEDLLENHEKIAVDTIGKIKGSAVSPDRFDFGSAEHIQRDDYSQELVVRFRQDLLKL